MNKILKNLFGTDRFRRVPQLYCFCLLLLAFLPNQNHGQNLVIVEPNVEVTPNTLRVAGQVLFQGYIDRIVQSTVIGATDTVEVEIFFDYCGLPGSFEIFDTTIVLQEVFPFSICVTTYVDTLSISSPCIQYNSDIDTVQRHCLSIDQILNTPERLVPQLDIYPNPARDHIQISHSGNGSSNSPYRIFDLNGRVITQGLIQPENPMIGISDLPDGFYVLELNLDGVPIRKKFVKNL